MFFRDTWTLNEYVDINVIFVVGVWTQRRWIKSTGVKAIGMVCGFDGI